MRKIGFRCECGDVDSPCRPCARAAASSVARRAVLATLACLVTCLPLHMGISPLSSSAYAATMPVGSPQTDPSLGFHDSYTYKGSRCVHSGVDISAAAGSAVKAPVDAVVSFVGRVPSGDLSSGASGSETMNAVSLKMGDGRTVTLMPLEAITVAAGDAVCEGAPVGSLAAQGDRSSKATHLHMGLKKGSVYYDPMSLFAGKGSASMAGTQELSGAGAKGGANASEAAMAENGSALRHNAPLPSGALEAQAGESGAEEELAQEGSKAAGEEFGVIHSRISQDVSAAREAAAGERTPGVSGQLAALCQSIAWQLDALREGFQALCEKLHVEYQLAVAACVLVALSVLAPIIHFIIRTIRRNGLREKESKNTLLPEQNGGVNMQKLFPAPGTSFITRGRLAQRR